MERFTAPIKMSIHSYYSVPGAYANGQNGRSGLPLYIIRALCHHAASLSTGGMRYKGPLWPLKTISY